jgi:hypothetical protein
VDVRPACSFAPLSTEHGHSQRGVQPAVDPALQLRKSFVHSLGLCLARSSCTQISFALPCLYQLCCVIEASRCDEESVSIGSVTFCRNFHAWTMHSLARPLAQISFCG